MIEYLASNPSFLDLHITQYGMEQCASLHDYGPSVRDYFLIHYVLEGQGTFETGNHIYHLEKGQAFLIFPGVVTYYQADADHPWKYGWVGFQGIQAESYLSQAGLSIESPILNRCDPHKIERHILQIHESRKVSYGRDLKMTSLLYSLFSHMAEVNPGNPSELQKDYHQRQDIYVQKVIDFIGTNYSNKISISQIANFVGLDRSYLCAVFRTRMGSSIQEYLIRFRINKHAR
ncbi:regulatory helix-turn-helix AraC family protein [Fontibacillus phaseoli]|uniref:Regulatory helix-turn-helix AraC family protein n=1 Tax=Fontibacillus phaseoli TaxID=1416533 RepID=A0A369BDZ4_9BACL|nr:AraC family transcriptional regulator [Fontibacillus phaseoli]RCX19621.1 regulatory helix-turn-helix AraC family protein [Fontibacillus phaseoli]